MIDRNILEYLKEIKEKCKVLKCYECQYCDMCLDGTSTNCPCTLYDSLTILLNFENQKGEKKKND